MTSYTTLEGDVLDLARLTGPERTFLERCLDAYRGGMPWDAYVVLAWGADNPLVEEGTRVPASAWTHPLWRAVRDIEDRLAIAQGRVAPAEGDHTGTDPLDDDLLTIEQAARAKQVSIQAIYGAIRRGAVIAAGHHPMRVSRRSLDRWQVDERRRNAGRLTRRAS